LHEVAPLMRKNTHISCFREYAIAVAMAIFLIGLAPTEIHAEEMLASSLLWIDWPDVVFALCVLAVTGLCFCLLHRVRVAISSSNAPRFEPNPNTGKPSGSDDKTEVATNTIYMNADHPSHILLPVAAH